MTTTPPAAPQPGDAERLAIIRDFVDFHSANPDSDVDVADERFLLRQIEARDAEITRLRAEIADYMAREAAECSTAIEQPEACPDEREDEGPTPALLAGAALLRSLTTERQPEASGEDVERLAAIKRHWVDAKAEAGFGYWPHRRSQDDVEFLLQQIAEARRAGAESMRELLPCGHFAANIGDTGVCEACMDMNAARTQGAEAMREMAKQAALVYRDEADSGRHPSVGDPGYSLGQAYAANRIAIRIVALPTDTDAPTPEETR